jgi:hypothetical protein
MTTPDEADDAREAYLAEVIRAKDAQIARLTRERDEARDAIRRIKSIAALAEGNVAGGVLPAREVYAAMTCCHCGVSMSDANPKCKYPGNHRAALSPSPGETR